MDADRRRDALYEGFQLGMRATEKLHGITVMAGDAEQIWDFIRLVAAGDDTTWPSAETTLRLLRGPIENGRRERMERTVAWLRAAEQLAAAELVRAHEDDNAQLLDAMIHGVGGSGSQKQGQAHEQPELPPDGYEGLWRLAEGVFRWEGKFAVPGQVYRGVARYDATREPQDPLRVSVWLKNPDGSCPDQRWPLVWLEEVEEAEAPPA